MATVFDRWVKDPFFYAAEEVQESTDRMESVYRRWMHEKQVVSNPACTDGDAATAELRRELHTALGTAKWQLDELERAVRSSDQALFAGEATITRHSDFVTAISERILMVELALKESNLREDEKSYFTWVKLNEGEREELALFLSSPVDKVEKALPSPSSGQQNSANRMNGEASVSSKDPCEPKGLNILDMEENAKGHRRTASASPDLGAWTISVSNKSSPPRLSDDRPNLPPPRILSLSELRTAESASKPKWYRNGFRKWKVLSQEKLEESIPLQNHQLSQEMNACYERSKSYLSDCTDDSYNKQLHGWLGALQRQIQRSQYQIQYGRPIQLIVWTIVTILLICEFLYSF
ncbi:Syntaxin-61 [Apostasia shenzhenica]|uniref:Syntaxin-61 n=1 Tax=Apostasia shenzhenica TaxID=1088818 RepID=A0A2I0A2K5_9ASPA|nr:Syntaxin-61 [Apostasia shenzhenica]